MIYVSSSCLKNNLIKQSIEELAIEGYKNIEISGNTLFYKNYLQDLQRLKDKYSLNYLIHNYFPPPEKDFMLNLASLNDETYLKSINHCLNAIKLCKILDCKKYSVHGGFLIDFSPAEAGNRILLRKINNRKTAIKRFTNAWNKILEAASDKIKIYIENNNFSKINFQTYQGQNPFLLTDYETYLELLEKINFKLLLDLAHLKVSCNTLNLNFLHQSNQLAKETDYFHISGNDGFSDQNRSITEDENIINFLKNIDLSKKTLTLEVYNGLDNIKKSYDLLLELEKKFLNEKN